MSNSEHFGLSIGGLIKKLLAVNPKLDTRELIDIVRQSTKKTTVVTEFGSNEVVDEAQALLLAQASKK